MSALSYLDLKTYLVSALNRMDKMSMAASLEARVPFLDHRLVEWGFPIPVSLKLRGTQTKYIVKKLAERYLPGKVVHRSKSGFGVPLADWLRDDTSLGRYLEFFREPRYRQRGYLKSEEVIGLVDAHLTGEADHSEILWVLINTELWYRIFIDKETM